MRQIEQNVWTIAYSKWATEIGAAFKVKPKIYLGLRGWGKYVKKVEIDGIEYTGEVWDCENEEGMRVRAVFRIPYYHNPEDVCQEQEVFLHEITNFHTDGIRAYETGKTEHIDRKMLHARNNQMRDRILTLQEWFKSLNNIAEPILKLGIQYYLRSIQTPYMATRREWKEFKERYKEGDYIIAVLQKKGLM